LACLRLAAANASCTNRDINSGPVPAVRLLPSPPSILFGLDDVLETSFQFAPMLAGRRVHNHGLATSGRVYFPHTQTNSAKSPSHLGRS
jgi:hypothetical protein